MNSNQNDQFIDVTRITTPPSHVLRSVIIFPLLSSLLFFPQFTTHPVPFPRQNLPPHHVPSPVAIAWHKRHPRIRAFVALLKVLSTPDRVSLCFTLELSDNKRETGARARTKEKEREDRDVEGRGEKGALRGGRGKPTEERERESIIYTAASCRLDYFNFFPSLFLSSLPSLLSPTVQLSTTAKVVLCRGRDRLFKCPPPPPSFLPFFVLMSATADKKRAEEDGTTGADGCATVLLGPTERSNDRPLVSEVRWLRLPFLSSNPPLGGAVI